MKNLEFEKLFREHSDVIYRLCLYKTGNNDVAHDLTQETFVRLWTVISHKKDIKKPKQYIYQIARNLIIDYYKSKKSVSLETLEENGFEPSTTESSPDLIAEVSLLKEVVDSLNIPVRDLIYMRFVEGMRVKDIAQILKISENLATIQIRRAKQKLHEKFK